MKTIDRKGFLAAKVEVPKETVHVPELGVSVVVRGLTGKEQTALYKVAGKKGGSGVDEDTFAAKLIASCLVDKDGQRLLQDCEWEVVNEKLVQSFSKVAQAAMRVNGFSSEPGNSNATDGAGSTSA
jgi:hypothetical protein